MKFQIWRINRHVLIPLVKIRFYKQAKDPFKITIEGKLLKYQQLNAPPGWVNSIYFFHPLRATRYFMGVQARLNLIGNEYCLEQVKNVKEGVFVDIGSNIGEFTLRAHQLFPAVSFVRFEPSKNENLASSKNLVGVNQILIEKPLWSSVTSMKFYNQNETGDSSLFQPTNDAEFEEIETSTLDIEISKLNIKRIELLKLEAEGAEPEILQGGKETLKITQMITADLGPERGIGQERTFDQVNDLLTEAGFVLVGRNSGNRECYLYERANR